jgi:predicted Zn-dependent peptidase
MEYYKLNNGLRVVLVPMPGVESVATGIYVGTGSRYETAQNNGISHFTEHMVFKGTEKFPTTRDVSYLEGLGAMQNAATSLDYTQFYCKIPADRWREGMEVVKELATKPIFPAPDIEMERNVILEEIKWLNDHPDDLIGDVMQEALFPNHPLGMPIIGRPDVIKKLTQEDFVQFHRQFYTPGNMVVALAGKIIDPDGVKSQIEEWFGSMQPAQKPDFHPFVQEQKAPAVKMLTKSTLNQAFIALAVPGLSNNDPRRFALSVLNSYLGQGFTSRFYLEVREKRGLCYTISSGEHRLVDTGYWGVFAGLNHDKLPEAITAILQELRLVKDKPISEKDLTVTKEKIRGPLIFSMENPTSQMNFYGKQVLEKSEQVLDYDTVINKLMQVTVEDVQNIANDLFISEKLNLAIVGPIKRSEEKSLLKLLQI